MNPDAPFGPTVARFDEAADRALDRLRGHPVADRFFYALSEAANFSLLWHAVNLGRLLLFPRRRRQVVALAIALGVESLLVNQGIKRAFRRDRPEFDGDHPHELRQPSTSSFPSGHATSAFLAAGMLGADHPQARPLWWALAGLVSLSRPYVRIHHASDVIGGAVIGAIFASIARALLRR